MLDFRTDYYRIEDELDCDTSIFSILNDIDQCDIEPPIQKSLQCKTECNESGCNVLKLSEKRNTEFGTYYDDYETHQEAMQYILIVSVSLIAVVLSVSIAVLSFLLTLIITLK